MIIDIIFIMGSAMVYFDYNNDIHCLTMPQDNTISEMNIAIKNQKYFLDEFHKNKNKK